MAARKKQASLADAISALDDRSPERALSSMLEVWRSTRSTELAAVIETLSAKLIDGKPAPFDARKNPRQEWITLANQRTDANLPWLLSTLFHPRPDVIEERLTEMLEWKADPRIATAALGLLQDVGGKNARRNAPHLLALLAKTGDHRVVKPLGPISKEQNRLGRSIGPQTREAVAALEKHIVRDVPAPELATLQGKLAGAATKPATDELDALFAAVYANPAEDGPRLVLADALQERGFPLGEFITLQVERARTKAEPGKREQQLLTRWQGEWAARWEPHLAGYPHFARGFLNMTLFSNHAAAPAEAWRTVEHVEIDLSDDPSDVLASPVFDSLKTLRAPLSWVLAGLERTRTWTELMTAGVSRDVEELTRKAAALPSLTKLSVYIDDDRPSAKAIASLFSPAWKSLAERTINHAIALAGTRLTVELDDDLDLLHFVNAIPAAVFESIELRGAAELHPQGLWLPSRKWFDPTPLVTLARKRKLPITFQRRQTYGIELLGEPEDLSAFKKR
ncbi:MAG: TIGR02996 domain-containing protein [Archangium sp.]